LTNNSRKCILNVGVSAEKQYNHSKQNNLGVIMKLYERSVTAFLAGGLIFMHILILGLSALFTYKFLIVEYDENAYLLVGMLIGMLALCDILLWRGDVHERIFGKARINKDGILCYGFCMRKRMMNWDDICIYGVTGESVGYLLIFLSTDRNEKADERSKVAINRKRVVFSARKEVIAELEKYMPSDMAYRIKRAVNNKTSCYNKR